MNLKREKLYLRRSLIKKYTPWAVIIFLLLLTFPIFTVMGIIAAGVYFGVFALGTWMYGAINS